MESTMVKFLSLFLTLFSLVLGDKYADQSSVENSGKDTQTNDFKIVGVTESSQDLAFQDLVGYLQNPVELEKWPAVDEKPLPVPKLRPDADSFNASNEMEQLVGFVYKRWPQGEITDAGKTQDIEFNDGHLLIHDLSSLEVTRKVPDKKNNNTRNFETVKSQKKVNVLVRRITTAPTKSTQAQRTTNTEYNVSLQNPLQNFNNLQSNSSYLQSKISNTIINSYAGIDNIKVEVAVRKPKNKTNVLNTKVPKQEDNIQKMIATTKNISEEESLDEFKDSMIDLPSKNFQDTFTGKGTYDYEINRHRRDANGFKDEMKNEDVNFYEEISNWSMKKSYSKGPSLGNYKITGNDKTLIRKHMKSPDESDDLNVDFKDLYEQITFPKDNDTSTIPITTISDFMMSSSVSSPKTFHGNVLMETITMMNLGKDNTDNSKSSEIFVMDDFFKEKELPQITAKRTSEERFINSYLNTEASFYDIPIDKNTLLIQTTERKVDPQVQRHQVSNDTEELLKLLKRNYRTKGKNLMDEYIIRNTSQDTTMLSDVEHDKLHLLFDKLTQSLIKDDHEMPENENRAITHLRKPKVNHKSIEYLKLESVTENPCIGESPETEMLKHCKLTYRIVKNRPPTALPTTSNETKGTTTVKADTVSTRDLQKLREELITKIIGYFKNVTNYMKNKLPNKIYGTTQASQQTITTPILNVEEEDRSSKFETVLNLPPPQISEQKKNSIKADFLPVNVQTPYVRSSLEDPTNGRRMSKLLLNTYFEHRVKEFDPQYAAKVYSKNQELPKNEEETLYSIPPLGINMNINSFSELQNSDVESRRSLINKTNKQDTFQIQKQDLAPISKVLQSDPSPLQSDLSPYQNIKRPIHINNPVTDVRIDNNQYFKSYPMISNSNKEMSHNFAPDLLAYPEDKNMKEHQPISGREFYERTKEMELNSFHNKSPYKDQNYQSDYQKDLLKSKPGTFDEPKKSRFDLSSKENGKKHQPEDSTKYNIQVITKSVTMAEIEGTTPDYDESKEALVTIAKSSDEESSRELMEFLKTQQKVNGLLEKLIRNKMKTETATEYDEYHIDVI